jgi:hypothetical protein
LYAAHAACRSLDHAGQSRRRLLGSSSVVAIGAALVVRLPATRGNGEGNVARLKVDHNRQIIRLTRQLRLSAMAGAAPNANITGPRRRHWRKIRPWRSRLRCMFCYACAYTIYHTKLRSSNPPPCRSA